MLDIALQTLAKGSIDGLRQSMEAGLAASVFTGCDAPVDHYHAAGLYGRRVYVPAGSVIVTKVHKSQHITVALKGICTVVDAQGNKKEVLAPAVFVTEPGTQRAVYAHTDTEWVTVHACEETDIPTVEALLVCDTMAEYEQLQLENKA